MAAHIASSSTSFQFIIFHLEQYSTQKSLNFFGSQFSPDKSANLGDAIPRYGISLQFRPESSSV